MEQIRHSHSTGAFAFRGTKQRSSQRNSRTMDAANLLLIPALITAFLWMTSIEQVSLVQAVCAWLLLCFPWAGYLSWRRQRRYTASLFVFVPTMYWLFYAVALFWGNRRIISIAGGTLTDEAITQAMIMAVLGVASLWAGMRLVIGKKFLPKRIFDIPSDPARWNYVRVILVLGTVFSLIPGTAYLLGEAGRQIILGFQNIVPLVAFIILFRHIVQGNATRLDMVLAGTYFLAKVAVGISSGWLGSIVFVVLACCIVYLSEKRRLPWLAIAPVLLYVVFFQAGKSEFRKETWRGQSGQYGTLEKVERWASFSLKAWQEALDDTTGEKRTILLRDVVMRVSLLTQTAHVLEKTPQTVPFQMGGTYSYLAATWVPRALWPDKPSASEANRFYQVAYGLTEEEDLDKVAMAIGSMTEGYINFGWFGVVGIMFSLGLLFNWLQEVFLVREAGWLPGAIGIVLVTRLIIIEAQMAMYVGGLVQQMFLVFLVFLPILHWRRVQIRNRQKISSKMPSLSGNSMAIKQ